MVHYQPQPLQPLQQMHQLSQPPPALLPQPQQPQPPQLQQSFSTTGLAVPMLAPVPQSAQHAAPLPPNGSLEAAAASCASSTRPPAELTREPPPFLGSLAQMHVSVSTSERAVKERQRQDWLDGLNEQIKGNEAKREAAARQRAEQALRDENEWREKGMHTWFGRQGGGAPVRDITDRLGLASSSAAQEPPSWARKDLASLRS